MNDLTIFSRLDQSLSTEKDWTWFRDEVNKRTEQAIANASLDEAKELVTGLVSIAKVSGRELSRVLYKFKENWGVFNTKETFDDWCTVNGGLHPHTIERYVKVEQLFANENIPLEIREEYGDRGIHEIIPVANMVAQGVEPTDEQWKKLQLAPDENTIRAVIREVKETPPRKSALILTMDDMGSLWCTKDGERYFFGSLEIELNEEPIQQAIERVVRNAGIIKT